MLVPCAYPLTPTTHTCLPQAVLTGLVADPTGAFVASASASAATSLATVGSRCVNRPLSDPHWKGALSNPFPGPVQPLSLLF